MSSRISDYEFKGTIGTGSTGTVYLAHQAELERDVAIKELAPELAADPNFIKRFRAEAKVMATLNSANCVRIYDFFETDGEAYLVSEYVDGTTLREVVREARRLTPEQSLGVLKGALKGLARAHELSLIHRDVKPENVLVDREGVSKLADFGQAVNVKEAEIEGGLPTGTAVYMSPEQARATRLDHRTDIYSCGVVLFELLCGRPPFAADNARAIMRKHAFEAPPAAVSVNSKLPEGISLMISKALAKDPADRQQSADEFLLELEATAVAAYGEDWEKRSSIKRLVLAFLPMAAVTAGGFGGMGVLVGAGGVAALLVAGTIYGFTRNSPTTVAQAGQIAPNVPPAMDNIRMQPDFRSDELGGQVKGVSIRLANAPVGAGAGATAGAIVSAGSGVSGVRGVTPPSRPGGGGTTPPPPPGGGGTKPPPPPPPAPKSCLPISGLPTALVNGVCQIVQILLPPPPPPAVPPVPPAPAPAIVPVKL